MKRSLFHSSMMAVLITIAAAASGNAQGLNLTGLWRDDTGNAVYRLRQVENRLFWTVDGTPIGRYANFAYGDINGGTINTMWMDMPGSPSLGWGYITLRIDSNDRLVKIAQSGNYRGSVWTRVGATTPTPPGGGTGSNGGSTTPVPPGYEGGTIAWDYRDLHNYRGKNGMRITFTCGPDPAPVRWRALYGNGVYTDDSCVCQAAVHAGRITTAGGRFTIEMLPGQTAYPEGGDRNGVFAAAYGSWYGSFVIR